MDITSLPIVNTMYQIQLATGEAGDISGKFMVNLKANWSVTKTVSLFLNGRNIFNDDSREFFGADQIGGLYTAGASFSLN